MNPSEWIITAGFVVIALLAWYGIHKTDPKLAPRIRSPRAENYDLAGGSWRRYRGRGDFDAEHPNRTRVGHRV